MKFKYANLTQYYFAKKQNISEVKRGGFYSHFAKFDSQNIPSLLPLPAMAFLFLPFQFITPSWTDGAS